MKPVDPAAQAANNKTYAVGIPHLHFQRVSKDARMRLSDMTGMVISGGSTMPDMKTL